MTLLRTMGCFWGPPVHQSHDKALQAVTTCPAILVKRRTEANLVFGWRLGIVFANESEWSIRSTSEGQSWHTHTHTHT